jgi:hypothetical protein
MIASRAVSRIACQRTSSSWSARRASAHVGVLRSPTSLPSGTPDRRPMGPRRAGRRGGGAVSPRSWRRGRDARLPSHHVNACPWSGQLIESPVRDEHRSVLGDGPVDRARFRKQEPEATALADEPGLRAHDSHLAPAGCVAHRPALTDCMGFSHLLPCASRRGLVVGTRHGRHADDETWGPKRHGPYSPVS